MLEERERAKHMRLGERREIYRERDREVARERENRRGEGRGGDRR